MMKQRYLGIDGCKAGWFFVSIGPGGESEFGIFGNIENLFSAYSDAKWMLIDIPIGLPSAEIPKRVCDSQARQILRLDRHHSIFSPACREALSATTYEEACKINHQITGRKISQQAYQIRKKILDVDGLLAAEPKARKVLRESHPEICFWALADQIPMVHYKKTEKGLTERLDILNRYFPRSSAMYKAAQDRYKRKDVSKDDILDALSLVVTASKLDEGQRTLPETSEKDQLKRPMEMVYAIPESHVGEDRSASKNAVILHDLEPAGLNTDSSGRTTTGKYAIIEADGITYLQINTDNSWVDKKNHSIRFGPKAIKQLKAIIENW